MKLYEFEGKQLSLKEIALLLTRYNIESVEWYLKQGYKTRQDILGAIPEIKAKKAMSAAAKKSPWRKSIHAHFREMERA